MACRLVLTQHPNLTRSINVRKTTMIDRLLGERYRIVEIMGSGTFGQTYLAEDLTETSRSAEVEEPQAKRFVVKELKLPSKNPSTLKFFLSLLRKKLALWSKLVDYDRVPKILHSFEQAGNFYLVEEFIAGHSLLDELHPQRTWPEPQVIQLLEEVLQILVVVHSHGIVRHCIKPANLIRRRQDGRLVLTGSGVMMRETSHYILPPPSQNGRGKVSLESIYIPLEQIEGNPQVNSDIYALGVIAIQALTGLSPEVLLKLRHFNLHRNSDLSWQDQAVVSDRLLYIVERMTHINYRQRYQSAQEVLNDLHALNTRTFNPPQVVGVLEKTVPVSTTALAATLPAESPDSADSTNLSASSAPRQPSLKVTLGLLCLLVVIPTGFYAVNQWRRTQTAKSSPALSLRSGASASPTVAANLTSSPPGNPHLQHYVQQAIAHQQRGAHQQALTDLTQAIDIDPTSAEAYYLRGNTRLELGDAKGAIADYNQAVTNDPQLVVAYLNRGTALAAQGDEQAALADYNEALRLKATPAEQVAIYINRCLSHSNLGNHEQAIADCSKAVQLQPANSLAYQNRGLAHRRANRPQAALQDYNIAMGLDKGDPEPHYNRGLTRKDLGDRPGAVADFSQAIRLNPQHALAYYDRALLLAAAGQLDKARQDMTQASTLCLNLGRLSCYRDAQYYLALWKGTSRPQPKPEDDPDERP